MRKGFTLVELSIVLVIVGLLIGGVLKGKSMIENAKIKRVKSDVLGLIANMYSFQDKYGSLPGDNTLSIVGATACAGNNNGLIDAAELDCAWQQLVSAKFLSGTGTINNTTTAKKTPYTGYYRLGAGTTATAAFYITTTANVIPNEVIRSFDISDDDGVNNTGDVRSGTAYTSAANATLTWYAY